MHLLFQLPSTHGTGAFSSFFGGNFIDVLSSRIMLALLSTGEAYLVDQRREHQGRAELCEVQEDSEEENQMSRPR
jgi:hypothetical protein